MSLHLGLSHYQKGRQAMNETPKYLPEGTDLDLRFIRVRFTKIELLAALTVQEDA